MKKLILSNATSAAIIVVCLSLIGTSVWAINRWSRPQQDASPIKNLSQSLQIVSVEEEELAPGRPSLKVVLRNGYSQNIAAYVISTGPTSSVTEFPIGESKPFAPGDTKVTRAISRRADGTYDSVAAVILEDGTGDGDPLWIQVTKNDLIGVRQQYRRFVPLLRQAANSPAMLSAVVERLKGNAAALPVGGEGTNVPVGIHGGRNSAKENILYRLDEVKRLQESSGEVARTAFTKMHEDFEEFLVRLNKVR